MTQTTDSREMVQTRADGRTRTFRFGCVHAGSFGCASDGMIMNIEIRDRDGQLVEIADYIFTDAEFEQFRRLVERA